MTDQPTLTTVAVTAADHLVGNLFFNFGALGGVAGRLHPDDLPEGNARVVYTEMCRLFREGRLSAGTLEGALKAQGFPYTEYATYLGQRVMVDSLPQLNDYAETILNWAEVQTIKRTATLVLAEADQPSARSYSLYPRLVQPPQRRMVGGLRDISEFGSDLLSDLDQWEAGTAEEGLSTGFEAMDAFFRLEKERLHVLAARPSMGKTSAAMQIGENVATHLAATDVPGLVAVFSAEMSGKSLALRMAAGGAGVNTQRLKRREATKDEYAKVRREVRRINDLGIKIDDSPSPSPEAMYYKLAMINAQIPVALVIFDFIELGNPDDKDKRTVNNEELRVSSIAKGLKELAKTIKAPVLALSQLSRKVEERRDKLPMLADLRYCIPGDTLIRLADGRPVRADTVKDGDTLLTLLSDFTLQPSKPVVAWPVGEKQTYRLRTKSGKAIRATANHPFLRYEGWSKLEDLKVGDDIALARRLPLGNDQEMTCETMRLLGYLIGDGSYKQWRSVEFTNGESACIDEVKRLAASALGITVTERFNRTKGVWQLALTGKGEGPGSSPAIEWIKSLGIHGQVSNNKRIPIVAMQSPYVAELLSTLILTDGCIQRFNATSGWMVKYSTNSPGLANDVQDLLLRLGVVSYLAKPQTKNRYTPLNEVIITGRNNVVRLLSALHLAGGKAKIAEAVLENYAHATGENGHIDRLPLAVNQRIELLKTAKGLSWQQLGYRVQGKRISRTRAEQVAAMLQDLPLALLATSDIQWDTIVAIEPYGSEMVYDICVPETENFVANDFIVHNSGMLEQAADVVSFIMRPEYYLKRNMTCYLDPSLGSPDLGLDHPHGQNIAYSIVAKQRDGNVGMLPMSFVERYTRFGNLTYLN